MISIIYIFYESQDQIDFEKLFSYLHIIIKFKYFIFKESVLKS